MNQINSSMVKCVAVDKLAAGGCCKQMHVVQNENSMFNNITVWLWLTPITLYILIIIVIYKVILMSIS